MGRKRLLQVAGVLLLAATPGLSVTFVLAVLVQATLFECIPSWNDEVGYWLQISAFREAGFGGGYFTVDERPARASFTHFYSHGPAFPLLYGCIARVVGWHPATAPFIHLALLFMALCVWGAWCRPSGTRAACTAFVLATYWPSVFLLPMTMQEGLHFAIAVLMAAAIQSQLRARKTTRRWNASIVAFVLVCAQFRATWSLVLIPYVWLTLRRRTWRRQGFGVATALALVATSMASSSILAAPYPNFLSRVMPMAWSSPGHALGVLVNHFLENEARFLSPTSGTFLETSLRYEIAGACLVALAVLLRSRRQGATVESSEDVDTAGFVLLNLLPVVGALLFFYEVEDFRDFRVLAPHFLLSLLVLLNGRAYRWALVVGCVNLILLVPFCEQFSSYHTPRVTCDRTRIETLRRDLAGMLRFEPTAGPWQNTVLVPMKKVAFPLLAVPPGMGVSARMGQLRTGERVEVRSKYILIDPRDFVTFLGDQPRLKFVGHTPYGDLYLNSDVGRGAPVEQQGESSKPLH